MPKEDDPVATEVDEALKEQDAQVETPVVSIMAIRNHAQSVGCCLAVILTAAETTKNTQTKATKVTTRNTNHMVVPSMHVTSEISSVVWLMLIVVWEECPKTVAKNRPNKENEAAARSKNETTTNATLYTFPQ
jgi:hypothetical protein